MFTVFSIQLCFDSVWDLLWHMLTKILGLENSDSEDDDIGSGSAIELNLNVGFGQPSNFGFGELDVSVSEDNASARAEKYAVHVAEDSDKELESSASPPPPPPDSDEYDPDEDYSYHGVYHGTYTEIDEDAELEEEMTPPRDNHESQIHHPLPNVHFLHVGEKTNTEGPSRDGSHADDKSDKQPDQERSTLQSFTPWSVRACFCSRNVEQLESAVRHFRSRVFDHSESDGIIETVANDQKIQGIFCPADIGSQDIFGRRHKSEVVGQIKAAAQSLLEAAQLRLDQVLISVILFILLFLGYRKKMIFNVQCISVFSDKKRETNFD